MRDGRCIVLLSEVVVWVYIVTSRLARRGSVY